MIESTRGRVQGPVAGRKELELPCLIPVTFPGPSNGANPPAKTYNVLVIDVGGIPEGGNGSWDMIIEYGGHWKRKNAIGGPPMWIRVTNYTGWGQGEYICTTPYGMDEVVPNQKIQDEISQIVDFAWCELAKILANSNEEADEYMALGNGLSFERFGNILQLVSTWESFNS